MDRFRTETLSPTCIPKINRVDENDGCEGIGEIRKGMHELTVSGMANPHWSRYDKLSQHIDVGLGIWSNPRIYLYARKQLQLGKTGERPAPRTFWFLLNLFIPPSCSQKTNLRSKHGIILSCTFDTINLEDWGDISELRGYLDALERSLAGEKYGFLTKEAKPRELAGDERMRQLWDELVKEMQS